MKIVAVADHESKALWDHYDENPLNDADIIVSCGDLDPRYLTFLATCSNLPLLYVHGNHDDRYDRIPPEGCICIEDRIEVVDGVRFLGLGGSYPYKAGKYMYSEEQMEKRISKISRQIKKHGGFDVLVTHASPRGIGDGEDFPHRGYEAFYAVLEKYHPQYMLHGHMHKNYTQSFQREHAYEDTRIISAYEKCEIDV